MRRVGAGVVLVALLSVSLAAAPPPLSQTPEAPARPPSAQQLDPAANWPQWRGPLGSGVAPVSNAPIHFSATEGVKWRADIPGRGLSSPIIWGDLVFVTTAVPMEEEEASDDRPRRRQVRLVAHEFRVVALDRGTGEIRWSRTAITAEPHEGHHRTLSSYANASPVTDGHRIYAFFGSRGLYAYDFDGTLAWSRDFGVQMSTFGHFGEGSGPALHGETIVLLFDHEEESFIEAVDTRTGETRWRRARDEDTSWSSPLIVEHDDVVHVVTSAGNFITSYDLGSGDVVWKAPGLNPHPIPTPVSTGDLLIATSASRESRVRAIELGRRGDLSGSDAVAWSFEKAAPFNPSPLLWDDELYLVRDGGMNVGTGRVSLLDARTGEPHYLMQHLPGEYTIKASPVAAGDRLYLATEEGDVVVVRRGPEFEILAVNPMGEPFIASPAIAHGELFLRGISQVICVSGDPGR